MCTQFKKCTVTGSGSFSYILYCTGGGSGLLLRDQQLPEKQLEHPGWDAGLCLYCGHHRVPGVCRGEQDTGHPEGAASAKDPAAPEVSHRFPERETVSATLLLDKLRCRITAVYTAQDPPIQVS